MIVGAKAGAAWRLVALYPPARLGAMWMARAEWRPSEAPHPTMQASSYSKERALELLDGRCQRHPGSRCSELVVASADPRPGRQAGMK